MTPQAPAQSMRTMFSDAFFVSLLSLCVRPDGALDAYCHALRTGELDPLPAATPSRLAPSAPVR